MELAHRYFNSLSIANDDPELKDAVISDFQRVIVNEIQSPKYPEMSFMIFADLSSIFSFGQEQLVIETPEDLFVKIIPFSKKHPYKIREFLDWMIKNQQKLSEKAI